MSRHTDCRRVDEDLTAYFQGELPPDRHAEVETHVSSCAACAAALEDVRGLFSMAGTVEDIVPSGRFKRDLARLIERESSPAREPMGERFRMAVAFLADRLRTSRRFRFATVSVAANVAIFLYLSLVLIPAQAEIKIAEFTIDPETIDRVMREEATGLDPSDPERFTPEAAEPLPVPRADDPFRRVLPPEMARLDRLLPPDVPVRRMPGVIFANVISPARKRAAFAASFAEPRSALDAVERGLAWLAKTQKKDGSWAGSKRGPGYETGVTATALLSFLADGHSETRGDESFRKVVRRAVDWLVARQVEEGELVGLVGANGKNVHYTYNHALATLALVEAYSLDHRRLPDGRAKVLRAAVKSAVSFAVTSQTPDGAWKYRLQSGNPGSYDNDTSVSVFMVTALSAARSARFHVPEKSFRGFARWLREVTGESGVVGYAKRGDRDDQPRTLTAGALFLEERLGLAAPLRKRQAKLVRAGLGSANHNCLMRFFSALAFRLRGEPVLHRFEKKLLRAQRTDGSWRTAASATDTDGGADIWAVYGGDAFLTAINVLTLTSAYRANP
ncbi:MAG: prenyltransferase/squalene oxidase repeat-containing protein [Planctomycetota bacterium]